MMILDFVSEGLKINLKDQKQTNLEKVIKGLPYFDNSQYCPVYSLKMD